MKNKKRLGAAKSKEGEMAVMTDEDIVAIQRRMVEDRRESEQKKETRADALSMVMAVVMIAVFIAAIIGIVIMMCEATDEFQKGPRATNVDSTAVVDAKTTANK